MWRGMLQRDSEGKVNTLTPLYLNQQALGNIGLQGLTVKVAGERKGKLSTPYAP